MSFATTHYDFTDPAQAYADLARDLAALLGAERDLVANLANAAALLYHALPDLNWAGFYLPAIGATGARELIVGPFQGRPACVRIAIGRGVCGAAAVRRETIVVPDVAAFDDHIACDAASRSEIVVPLLRPDRAGDAALAGVLDLDSPKLARFGDADRAGLERIANIIVGACEWPG
ncbi:MAG: Free methionine-R-sulfoxide reductase [Steroidobacteraceae bacterium]|nr:Free methionine-R-sulfoxide reductase [Steroidobacteraceae bacterium]